MFILGVLYTKIEYVSAPGSEGDYSKWLGPDWKPEWENPGAVIMNHTCFIDILFGMVVFFPSFVSKKSVKAYPFVGNIATALDCVFLERAGTKEEKIKVAKQLEERQAENERSGKPPILVFPEGATTNNKSLIKFKRGAFSGLSSVQPVCAKYWSLNGISPQNDTLLQNHYYYQLLSLGTTIDLKVYPVFKPNEYFWKHHFDEKKGLAKWEVYAQVVREHIMRPSFDFALADISME